MIEHPVHNRVLRDPRRNQNRRYPHAQPVELELRPRSRTIGRRRELVRRTRWWYHMVVDASMLVINNQQRGVGPQVRVPPDTRVHLGNQELPGLHVVVRMLVAGYFLASVGFVVVIVRLDKRILRQQALVAVAQELLVGSE